ncbi:type II secretion system protein N [Shewanella sp. 10N.286.48.B5]|uniref:type II secretion system protein N n=1 Tax=Shewanella sp. 10N.286.48.B5 TaxID=1880834 RepID=UPI000C8600F6|nr:type II secretion system protein N [Shewanella sp. 10N.286.48.B5]PMH89036.1 type II secretion system protein N [Shewanella sp. 10N.286.48.B5]
MSLIKKIILGVFVYLIFLVVFIPANWLVGIAPLPNNIKVSGVSGTLWQGSADLVSIDRRLIEQVSWDLNPWTLFIGQLYVDLQIGSRATPVSGQGDISWSLAGVSAENLRFEAPNKFLLGNAKLPFRTMVDGDVSLIVESLKQGTPWCEQLTGKLFLNAIDVKNQFGEYPLGDIALGLSCIDGQVQLMTDDSMNKMGIQGSATLGENNRIVVSAKIKPTHEQPQDLTQALSFLGKQDSQGYYPVNYQGTIPGL